MSFYLALFVFILSIIIGLALMIGGKRIGRDKFLLLTSIHAIFLFAFIAFILLRKQSTGMNNYFFTSFICSGLIMSGLSWRSNPPKFFRIYFSVFALTIPMFLISPSMLLNFLLTMNFSSSSGPSFHLAGKYFLETQSVSNNSDEPVHYKLIRKKGMFHQNIQRDITFGGKLDSARILESDNNTMLIRGFTSTATHVSVEVDSVDVKVMLRVSKPGDVEYRL